MLIRKLQWLFGGREDYLKEVSKQLEDKDVYEGVQNDPSTLINIIMRALEKVRIRDVLFNDTLNDFLLKDPKFARFYFLPRICWRLHNVSRRTIISNCGFYTENISSFLDHYLQPIAQKINSFIKDTNNFLRKIEVWINFWKELVPALLMLLVFSLTSHTKKALPHLENS